MVESADPLTPKSACKRCTSRRFPDGWSTCPVRRNGYLSVQGDSWLTRAAESLAASAG
jgi:hypothetical protein